MENDWIVNNPEPLKYVITPTMIDRGDAIFNSNTLPRSIGDIETTIDPSSILRDSKLTTSKGRHDLVTDRIGLTTPHIRYGDLDNLPNMIPQESLPVEAPPPKGSQHTPFCNRGHHDHEFARVYEGATYANANLAQHGFGENLGTLPGAIDTRNIH